MRLANTSVPVMRQVNTSVPVMKQVDTAVVMMRLTNTSVPVMCQSTHPFSCGYVPTAAQGCMFKCVPVMVLTEMPDFLLIILQSGRGR